MHFFRWILRYFLFPLNRRWRLTGDVVYNPIDVGYLVDDSDGDHNWAITGIVDLDSTQDTGEVVFFDYSVSHV